MLNIIKNHWIPGALVLLVLPWFFVNLEVGANQNAWGRTMDMFHFLFFLVFSIVIFRLLSKQKVRYPLLLGSVISVVIIVSIEVIQPVFGRSSTFTDLGQGLLGLATGAIITSFWRPRSLINNATILLVFLLALGLASFEVTQEWYAVYKRQQQFPVLGSFEDNSQLRLWRPTGIENNSTSNIHIVNSAQSDNKLLKIITKPNDWSGVWYSAGDLNWSDYRLLSFKVYNPGAKLSLIVRIDEAVNNSGLGQRINETVVLEQGWNNISIDLTAAVAQIEPQTFNLAAIRKLVLFTHKSQSAYTFYLDNVHLRSD